MFNHLIFDLDNNLYNYTLCNNLALNIINTYIFNTYNIDLIIIQKSFNEIKKKYHNTVFHQASSHNKCIQFKKLCEYLNLPIKESCNLYDLYIEEFNKHLELFDGVEDFLNLCNKNNINCYILTNNICYEQINRLKKLNICQYFKKIITSEEYGIEKPDSKIFYSILQENNIHINEVAMIGDSFKNDIQSVNLLGMYGFWFYKNEFNLLKNYCEFNHFQQLIDFFHNYYIETNKFIELSKYCGERYDLVQAGGGNISFKIDNLLFIKSSGCLLGDMEINKNYVCLDKNNIINHLTNIDSNIKKNREKEAKQLCDGSILFLKNYKPSIETMMHCLTKKYSVHLHPLQFLKICGLENCNDLLKEKFNDFCFIDYFTPGIDVALELNKIYDNQELIFLKNHGIVLTSDNVENLYILLENTINKLEEIINMNFNNYKFTNYISKLMNKITNKLTISYLSMDYTIKELYNNTINLKPYFPDKLVYCGINIIYLNNNFQEDLIKISDYQNKYYEIPKLFFYKNNIYINSNSIKKCIDIECLLKSHLICYNKNNNILSNEENNYLNNWDAEKYRKNI
jgi:HAD superfamily hydrolase (TIGR01549 family)